MPKTVNRVGEQLIMNKMKTLKLSVVALMAAGFLASCGGGMKGDMKKSLDLSCKATEASLASMKAPEDAKLKEASEKANKAAEDFGKKMAEKYKDAKPDEKLSKWVEEEMGKCKAFKDMQAYQEEQMKKIEAELKAAQDSANAELEAALEASPSDAK